MTEIELYYDGNTAVSHFDAEGIVPTAATVTLTKADGTVVSSPTVTLPTLSTTIAAGTTATSLVLASVAGILRGDHLKVTTAGIDYVVEAANVNGTTKTVTLITALPAVPSVADVVKSLKMVATIAAPGASLIGGNLRITWDYSTATQDRHVGYPASVVRWPFTPPCNAADVAAVVAELGGGVRSEAWCQDVADRVVDRIKGKLAQTGRRPWLYLSSSVFTDAARQGIRYELAQRNIALGGQIYEAQRELRFAAEDTLATVITSLAGYDKNADGVIDADEARPMHFTVQVVR